MTQARRRAHPIESVCAFCGNTFLNEGYWLRRCCNRSCGAKLKLGKNVWSQQEKDLLELIAGTVPRHDLPKVYNRRAVRHGFIRRSSNAVVIELKRLGLSQEATEDNWKISTLANLLGVNRDRVRTWTQGRHGGKGRSGGLLPYRKVSNTTAVSREDFAEFAHTYPEKLRGIHPRNLAFVLSDKKLIREIAAMGRPTTGYNHALICVETGQKFRSAKQAGRELFMHPKHILRQARKGKKAYGLTFKVLEIGSQDYSHLQKQF